MQNANTAEGDARFWPTYRPRRAVVAKRLERMTTIAGRLYPDGYMVRDETGHVHVMQVAEFEAIYEPAGLGG